MRLWFDFVDPVSYVLELELCAVAPSLPHDVERMGIELVAPPAPLTSIDDALWSERFATARPLANAKGVHLAPPAIVPWTRKAHELHAHAIELGRGEAVRLAIYEAYFGRGDDIGRIDRLVSIAGACGLDPSAARTVLGVDRHEEFVVSAREAANATGVTDVPTLEVGGSLHRGFHNRDALLTLLYSTPSP